jgi:hypothetical protein
MGKCDQSHTYPFNSICPTKNALREICYQYHLSASVRADTILRWDWWDPHKLFDWPTLNFQESGRSALNLLNTNIPPKIQNPKSKIQNPKSQLPEPPVTLDELDPLLAQWHDQIDRVNQNLLDLYDIPTYQQLSGTGGFTAAALTGISQAQVAPALEAMNELFQHFDLLQQTLARAQAQRQQLPRFLGADAKMAEIAQMLTGPSIQLPAVLTPLAQRSLLSAAEVSHKISPTDLLQAMAQAFARARDAVFAVDQVWSAMTPQLLAADTTLQSLRAQSQRLDVDVTADLDRAAGEIGALRDRMFSDPLGVQADYADRLTPLLQWAQAALDQAAHQKTQIQAQLAQGRERLRDLRALNQKNMALFAECQEKVLDPFTTAPPCTAECLDALDQWLDRLDAKFHAPIGALQPVTVGLRNWTQNLETTFATETAALATNSRPLEIRRELRGRLDALKAKALSRGMIEESGLVALAQEAHQLLYSRPTPLARSASLVSQYEQRLNGSI